MYFQNTCLHTFPFCPTLLLSSSSSANLSSTFFPRQRENHLEGKAKKNIAVFRKKKKQVNFCLCHVSREKGASLKYAVNVTGHSGRLQSAFDPAQVVHLLCCARNSDVFFNVVYEPDNLEVLLLPDCAHTQVKNKEGGWLMVHIFLGSIAPTFCSKCFGHYFEISVYPSKR